jgi:hypothetical protein
VLVTVGKQGTAGYEGKAAPTRATQANLNKLTTVLNGSSLQRAGAEKLLDRGRSSETSFQLWDFDF